LIILKNSVSSDFYTKPIFMKTTVFTLSLLLLLFNCKKEETTTSDPQPSPSTTNYFSANIGSNNIDFSSGYVNGTGTEISNEYYGEFSTLQNATSLFLNYIQVTFVKRYPTITGPADCPEALSVFSVGNYPYGNLEGPYSEGITIRYVDNSGVEWKSDYSPATQSGSAFNLDSYSNSTTTSKKQIKATFNCTLHDDYGNTLMLTNGVYSGEVGSCL
jgi:hypothetical protein